MERVLADMEAAFAELQQKETLIFMLHKQLADEQALRAAKRRRAEECESDAHLGLKAPRSAACRTVMGVVNR